MSELCTSALPMASPHAVRPSTLHTYVSGLCHTRTSVALAPLRTSVRCLQSCSPSAPVPCTEGMLFQYSNVLGFGVAAIAMGIFLRSLDTLLFNNEDRRVARAEQERMKLAVVEVRTTQCHFRMTPMLLACPKYHKRQALCIVCGSASVAR